MTELGRSLFETVDATRILIPVDARLLNFSQVQHVSESRFIKENSTPLPASSLLLLSKSDIYKLSKKFTNLFNRTAWNLKIKKDETLERTFRQDDTNAFVHEIAHLRKIDEFKPEVIDSSSVNVLPVTRNGRLSATTILISPNPNTPYTVVQNTEILLAPNYPSSPDYIAVADCLKRNRISRQEYEVIRDLIESKPDTEIGSKRYALSVLDSLDIV